MDVRTLGLWMQSKPDFEEICKRSFDTYLSTNVGAGHVAWRRGEDPPDYYVRVDGVTYAVEVTTVMEMVMVDSTQFPVASIVRSVYDLACEVEKQALLEGALRGHYAITIPRPIPNFTRLRPRMKERALDYIRRTKVEVSAAPEVILEWRRHECTIQKASDSSPKVSTVGPMTAVGFEVEFKREACRLLDIAITTKADKLSHLSLPRILLLLNEYHIVDSRHYKECIPTLTSLDDFHTVFIVEDEATGYVLHTSSPDW